MQTYVPMDTHTRMKTAASNDTVIICSVMYVVIAIAEGNVCQTKLCLQFTSQGVERYMVLNNAGGLLSNEKGNFHFTVIGSF